jgi:diguanylate cyclase (GGDEF)-like protein/PAS domain S-box-containing protein
MNISDQANIQSPSPASTALLSAVIESAPVAMLLSEPDGRICLLNREAELLFGFAREELLGRPVDMLVPEPSAELHAGLRSGYLERAAPHRMGVGRELSGQRKDGTMVPVEVALSPIQVDGTLKVLSVIVDISERRRLERRFQDELEQRVRERTAQLEHANRDKEVLLVDLQNQRAEFERLSREDSLTHLANRRDFDRCLDAEIDRAERSGKPLAVAMLDLDLFKSVNDRFGHAVGDAVLREVATIIRRQCRSIDVIARYGGEEFALALPGTDLEAGAAVCERIRRALLRFDWQRVQPGLAVTTSAGVSCWGPGQTTCTLLALADSRLYEAKRAGRNRVLPAPPAKFPRSATLEADPRASSGLRG